MKKTIITILLTAIICITGTATAAYIYTARDIDYVPTDNNWNVSNVQDAISNLKTDVNNINELNSLGSILYPAESVNLVGLVNDDSYYKDNNGYYILSNSDIGRTMLEDSNTYKSIINDTELKGRVGSEKLEEVSSNSNTFPLNQEKIPNKYFKLSDFQSYKCSSCNVTITGDKFTLNGAGPSYIPTDGAIVYIYADVTNYNSFKFRTTRDSTSGRMYGIVSSNKPETYSSFSGFDQAVYVSDTTANTLFSIDVSNLTGYKYIGVYHRGSNTYVSEFYLSH